MELFENSFKIAKGNKTPPTKSETVVHEKLLITTLCENKYTPKTNTTTVNQKPTGPAGVKEPANNSS